MLFFYGTTVAVPIGLVFNSIEFAVLTSKDFEKTNFGFQMNLQVISSSFSLAWNFIVYKYLPSIGLRIDSFSSITCCLFVYLSRVIQSLPLYTQVLVSFMNYLSVAYTSKFNRLNKQSYFVSFFVLIFIMLCVLNALNSIRY